MQFLALFILIGVTQRGDSTDSNTLSPDDFIDLGIPNCQEYVTNFKLSVQTAYLTSVECMLSSSIYIESGFCSIDASSNSAVENVLKEVESGIEGFKNTVFGLQITDSEKNAKETIEAVEYMTVNYYKKKDVVVKKSETTLSTVTEVKQAKSLLTVQRCQSAYAKFEKNVTAIQSKYDSGSNNNPWDYKSKKYYEAREEAVNLPGVYSAIRDAFLLGNGISMCEGTANNDKSLLNIYNTEDLSSYFGKKDNNDALTLLSQTVTESYKIYKASLTTIYLKSVVHSDCDLAMRITEWEQLNLVRANFEFKSQRIEKFIIDVKKEAEGTFGLDSTDYRTIMTSLYTSVNKMLLTVVKSTEVTYKRAMNFNIDRTMMKTDYNKLKVDVINAFYAKILFSNNDASRYDIRVIRKEDCPLPTKDKCLPQNFYPLVINTLIFQTFITEIKFLYIRLQSVKLTAKTVDSWILEKITLGELQNSIIFSRCSARANKVFILNSATFVYISMQTDQSIQSTDFQIIIDQVSNDVIGKLSINALDVTDTFGRVDTYIRNIQPQTKPVAYKPKAIEYNKGGNGNGGTPSPSGGTGSPPPSGGTGSPPPSGGTGSPPPSGGTGSPPPSVGTGSPPPSGGTGSPPPSEGYGSPPPSGGTGSPPPSEGNGSPPPSGGTGSPPPSGGTGSPPSGGTGSPPPSRGTGSPPPSEGNGSPPPSGGTGSPPSGGTGSPPPSGGTGSPPPEGSSYTPTYPPEGGNSANGDNSINNPTTVYRNTDYKYTYITSGAQIIESVNYYNESFTNEITESIKYVKSAPETEYTKMLLLSLEFTQKIFVISVDYLESVASDSIEYITQAICVDSDDFRNAIKSVFRDTTEKTGILWSTTEIPFNRINWYPLTCTEYVAVYESIGYTEYIQNVYKYFKVTYVEVNNQNNDADLFLTSSLEKFTQVYNEVYKAVEQTPDDAYRTFLLCYLSKTLAAYTKTIECFKKEIVEMQPFISNSQNSKVAFYKEIVQMVESIGVIYTSCIVKSKAYSISTNTVNMLNSEYDEAIKTTIIITTSVTEIQTAEFQISDGNNS